MRTVRNLEGNKVQIENTLGRQANRNRTKHSIKPKQLKSKVKIFTQEEINALNRN